MGKRILIANRGEIAVRVIKTAKEMGFETVAIYAEDDKDLLFSKLADFKVSLGDGSPKDTYLDQDKIIKIAKDYNIWGIHPGYGFLSENPIFCERVEKEGLTFIGANPEAMRIMGDKKESKVYIEKLKLPLIPGYHGDNQDPEHLKQEAKKIGYPVLVKASAGGGGKGMRIVHEEKDFLESLEAAKSEAMKSFSNDIVLIEKFITKPRHIEVQLMSDTHGSHFHFYERECSIQRRYQKIIEETPAPGMDDKLRQDICAAAVKIAEGVNYRGAGTLEFILDDDNNFYFLEMNTRLQVEHPISEMITGHDLVRHQINVALGEKLNFKQEDITSQGHSIECRIYAENPDNNFLPTTGKIKNIGHSLLMDIRVETGYLNSNDVNVNYDPMIAKIVVRAASREIAIDKMNQALNDFPFLGIKTNRDYLKRVLKSENFRKGNIDTNFVVNNDLSPKEFNSNELAILAATRILGDNVKINETNAQDIKKSSWSSVQGFRNI